MNGIGVKGRAGRLAEAKAIDPSMGGRGKVRTTWRVGPGLGRAVRALGVRGPWTLPQPSMGLLPARQARARLPAIPARAAMVYHDSEPPGTAVPAPSRYEPTDPTTQDPP
jgi:hypothetical protein